MRVRFAPSPTGALHIGGARTALYNWLLAKGSQGQLVLRIEDTDRERSTPENVEQILDALRWLELDWNEGPIFQSERAGRHAEALKQLISQGKAYYSNATAEDVKSWKTEHGSDRGFRGEPEGDGAVRLRVPDTGQTVVEDIIRGAIVFEHAHLDDPVIARADGSVLYNFAVAVDDLDAGITHVVRGEDHLSNTPKQLLAIEALGAQPPQYAHLPLLHGPDGKKLSKRHGAASVQELRDAGYLPEAVRNYVALLGWGYDSETTFFTTGELAEKFSLERVSRSSAVFDEQKLRWMNGHYLRGLSVPELSDRINKFLISQGVVQNPLPVEKLQEVVAVCQEKIQTLVEFWPLAGFIFTGPKDDAAAFEKWLGGEEANSRLLAVREALESAPEPFGPGEVEQALRGAVEKLEVKPKQLFQPLRVALSGTTVSPGIFETVALVGRDEALSRLDRVLTGAHG